MAQQTEAECLLDAGALYASRVLLRPVDGPPVFAGLKAGAFSLYFGDEPIFHYDLEGRWDRAFVNGLHELKGLDGIVRSIDRPREGRNLVLRRSARTAAETAALDERARRAARDVLDQISEGRLARVEPTESSRGGEPLGDAELRAVLERIARWDADAWRGHQDRYRDAYGQDHWPFLPPDCQRPLVLQATLGQSEGKGFGGAPGGDFRARSPEEFAAHAGAVARLFGRRIEQCANVFIGGPDVLLQPPEVVNSYLATTACAFPVGGGVWPKGLGGVHVFIDQFRPPLPSAEELGRFRSMGLTRVSLGVESGAPAVRAFFGKDWTDEGLRSFVGSLKAAGIGVGVMTLVGAGGAEAAESHVKSTTELIATLDLGPSDLVSLLDAREFAAIGSSRGLSALPYTPLQGPEWSEQLDAFKRALTPLRVGRKVKVAPYSLEKQGAS